MCKWSGMEIEMFFMTDADGLATIEKLLMKYVDDALANDDKLNDASRECTLGEGIWANRSAMIAGVESRSMAESIPEEAAGRLRGCASFLTYFGGAYVPSGSNPKESKKRAQSRGWSSRDRHSCASKQTWNSCGDPLRKFFSQNSVCWRGRMLGGRVLKNTW